MGNSQDHAQQSQSHHLRSKSHAVFKHGPRRLRRLLSRSTRVWSFPQITLRWFCLSCWSCWWWCQRVWAPGSPSSWPCPTPPLHTAWVALVPRLSSPSTQWTTAQRSCQVISQRFATALTLLRYWFCLEMKRLSGLRLNFLRALGHQLDFQYIDDECDDLVGPGKIVDLQHKRNYSAFIGPCCSNVRDV